MKLIKKVHECKFENLPISSSSHENNVEDFTLKHLLRFEISAREILEKFVYIRKQYNKIKISVLFKKFTNFTGK